MGISWRNPSTYNQENPIQRGIEFKNMQAAAADKKVQLLNK